MAKLSRFTQTDPSKPLQLSFSQWEKAKTLSEECARAREAGRIDDARYHTLQDFYIRHMQRAQEKVEFLRAEHRHRAEALRKELQETARRQAELSKRVTAGEIDAHKANRLNQDLMAEIARLRSRFLTEDQLAQAQGAADVGGLVDLPLEAYGRVGASGLQRMSLDRMAGTVIPVLASLAVFLTWLEVDGTPLTLGGIGGLLQERGLLPAADLVRVLVVGGVIVPLIGAAFAWTESRRVGGLGLLSVGIAMIALTIALVAAAGALSDVAMLRLGPVGYGAAGAILIWMGQRKSRGTERTAWSLKRGLLAAGLGLAALIAVGWFMLGINQAGPGLRIAFGTFDPQTQTVSISVANQSGRPVSLYAPWPQGTPGGPLVEDTRNAFGASVYVREAADGDFRLFPDAHDCWLRNGQPSASDSAIVMAPNAVEELQFDAGSLESQDLHPTAIRLVFTNGRGGVLASDEIAVPQE